MMSGKLYENGLRLYTLDTMLLTDDAYFQTCYHQLSASRRAKVDGYLFWKDKRLSLGAGMLLDQGLREYGLRESEVRIGQKKNGKPYLPDYPLIHFNLAHSETMVLVAFADAEVGCDIEYTKKADMELAKHCFRPEEYAYLAGLAKEAQDSAFFRLWTLKESFLKATGMGMELPMHTFGFDVSGDSIKVRQTYDGYEYKIKQYHDGRYWAAVCIQQ